MIRTPVQMFSALAAAVALLEAAPARDVLIDRLIPARTATVPLRELSQGQLYALLVSALEPSRLPETGLEVKLVGVGGKRLHPGDGDLYLQARAGNAPPQLQITGAGRGQLRVRVSALSEGFTEIEPNDDWRMANPLPLGGVLAASADDAAYLPAAGTKPDPEAGADWYRIDFDGRQPKLVFFQLEFLDRDNIPADVTVWRVVDGQLRAYTEGEDPVTLPHEVQALPGNKFTTRILREPGAYYVKALARHPAYRIRTRVYDPPPYPDPRQAVQTAVDYLLGAGDSWHANTPRRGGVWSRAATVHQETSLCVACHPTHFTLRAALYANRQGYPIPQREQLDFLVERFYNNPRPLFGFEAEGAVWARVISAPANVLGRMSHLVDLYERQIAGERRDWFHQGIRRYLELYYQGRTQLPPDETNGNVPLVSAYEVAWYAWENTRDPNLARLVEQDSGIKNLVDLCYQTLALASIDPQRYRAKIQANAERLLRLQRPSGQWSMKFEAEEKEVEFQTGHVLWALQAAGIPRTQEQVARGLNYLLSRQQPFGGWMDPLQSFENFRTPFRETQMAVLALSAYFPQTAATPPAAGEFSAWGGALGEAMRLEALAQRAAADALPEAVARLGHPSKLVQRAAAYLVRQILTRREVSPQPLIQALASPDERVRWGATRVFATHFAALARRDELAAPLMARLNDPAPAIALQAAQAAWQWWFWTPSPSVRDRIEDALLDGLRQPSHPWVEQARRNAVYNIADENIRYLYNNWVPLVNRAEDRDRIVRGRLAIEERQARKFAEFLREADDASRKRLLSALVEFPLRRADIYDPQADHRVPVSPPVYNRIGNDIEQIAFFGPSAERLAEALLPLLESADADLRRLARDAAQLVRDANFAAPAALAGPAGPARAALLARTAPPTPPASVASAPAAAPAARPAFARPDEAYFRGYVQPILETRGKDGVACVHCHASHAIFDGSWSTALRVVDLADPENSLILRKPTSSAEIEGTLEAQSGGAKLSHGGGVRWEKGSPEYNTILNWIRGAKP